MVPVGIRHEATKVQTMSENGAWRGIIDNDNDNDNVRGISKSCDRSNDVLSVEITVVSVQALILNSAPGKLTSKQNSISEDKLDLSCASRSRKRLQLL
ncbi:hypothetical protein HZH66_001259 [Vespula vulgaris]|uniref:Uncharacterized protein n=1 Tax=Vespula vulgaris TaxID=7454 RepID=A0A834KSX4_VESVU|nr:hypothetical protein HZH66_001259 [Vespula vulgaris]